MKHVLVYSALALLILWELLLPGYFFALDSVWGKATPEGFLKNIYGVDEAGKEFFGSPMPLAVFLFYIYLQLDRVLPLWLLQKLLLFLFLVVSGVTIHRVVPVKSEAARYFAGIMYMVNPFIYIRFLAGHLYLLWGYALLPLVVKAFADVAREQSRRNIAKASLLFTLVIPQVHFLPMVLGVFILLLLARAKRANAAKLARALVLVLVGFMLLNLSWVASIAIGEAGVEEAVKQVTPEHLAVFTSRPAFDFNVLFNVAAMYGFWRGGFELPKWSIPAWYLHFFFILFLAVHGFVIEKERKRRFAYPLGIAAVAALVLATGVTHAYLSKLFLFLYENIPFFAGFREPQKFVALLVFVYAYFGAIAVDEFAEKAGNKRLYYIGVIAALATPLIYTHSMLFAFDGQLKSADYPRDWYEVDEFLNNDEDDFNVLFLPWHGYMDFKWLKNKDKRIANPAQVFFTKPVIQGDTVEAGRVYSQSTYPVSKYIEFLLANRARIDNFGELIAPLNVKYVILAKEADYPIYDFLFKQSDMERVKETENLYLFRNRHEVAKIYAVEGLAYIKNWEELLQRSREEDITSKVYLLGEGRGEEQGGKEILSYERKNPARYVLRERPTKKYLVFAAPYSESWRLGEEKPLKNLGITNAYEVEEGPPAIEYTSYKGYLLGYAVSIAFFILLIREALRAGEGAGRR